MTVRMQIAPSVLRWALARSGESENTLRPKFKRLADWINATGQPTFRQLQNFARATRTPIGFFFLPAPPREDLPIPDFRTIGNVHIGRPSPDLLQTIYACERRQEWYRQEAAVSRLDSPDFVGSLSAGDDVVTSASRMRDDIGFSIVERARLRTWTEALRRFVEQADNCGVLVMINGVVGHNTHRRLNPEEFRGFALSDPVAPLVFVNGADTKAAQMFTLAHEIAHIWSGTTGISDSTAMNHSPSGRHQATERWCNAVAAEFLVPLSELKTRIPDEGSPIKQAERGARAFKVSTLVALRRIFDAGRISRSELSSAYSTELERLKTARSSGGGDFYRTAKVRSGERLSKAVLVSLFEGRTSYSESFSLLGMKNADAVHRFAQELGVIT